VCAGNGIAADLVPEVGARTATGVEALFADEPVYGSHVLVVAGDKARSDIADALQRLGATVRTVVAYRNVVEAPDPATVERALTADIVTFTAASTVANFVKALPGGATMPPAISIGPTTTQAATARGIEVVAEARDPSVSGIVVAVLEHLDSAGAKR
jgi:uroporphyrinogen-III synthase